MKKFFKYFGITLAVIFCVISLFIFTLFFRDQKLPRFIVNIICEKYSNENNLVCCESMLFGFRNGLIINGLSVYDRKKPDALEHPVVQVGYLCFNIFDNQIRVSGAKYNRLPDSYYEPADPTTLDTYTPFELDLTDMEDYHVVVESSSILGLKIDNMSFNLLPKPDEQKILFRDVSIKLAEGDENTKVVCKGELDVKNQRLIGDISGNLYQHQMRPFLKVMDIKCVLPYVDAFTALPKPVPSSAKLEVDLSTGDMVMMMRYSPTMGCYNSVPMSKAVGGVDFYSFLDGNKRSVATKIKLSRAVDQDKRSLSGWLTVENFSDKFKIDLDATSTFKIEDLCRITGVIDPSIFDFIEVKDPVRTTASGTLATSSKDIGINDLSGKFEVSKGSVKGFNFRDLKGSYSLKGDVLDVSAELKGKKDEGGLESACHFTKRVYFDKFESKEPRFEFKGSVENASLAELSEVFDFDLEDKKGRLSCSLELKGSFSPTGLGTLNGKGSVRIKDGVLNRMKMFSVLTDIIAKQVPGASFLTDQTQASADFTIENGVLKTENIFIEGSLFSVKASGTYDLVANKLDLVVGVQFLKKDSFVGKIVNPVTMAFTKLLLEYRVTGPIENSKWERIDLSDRITDTIL